MNTQISVLSPSVTIRNGKPVTTSQAVAEYFSKRHDDILRKIRNLECSPEFSVRNFAGVEYTDTKGEKRPAYQMTKDGFVFLVMGFTGKKAAMFKEAYIAEFNRMEKKVHQQSSTVIAPHRECLPKMVYHQRSKYNPYRAYAWDGVKSVYVDTVICSEV